MQIMCIDVILCLRSYFLIHFSETLAYDDNGFFPWYFDYTFRFGLLLQVVSIQLDSLAKSFPILCYTTYCPQF